MELINGIEILDKIMIYDNVFKWNTNYLGYIILGIMVIAFAIAFGTIDTTPFFAGILISLTVSIFAMIFGYESIPTNKYEYKVIINKDIDFNEFTDKYQVIKQEGRIFTIQLKEE